MKNILYIGNKLSNSGNSVTSIETLGQFLIDEGYKVKTYSEINNKLLRLIQMLFQTFKNRKKVDIVLIDTYSTQNFYFAVGVAKVCRAFKLPYILILRGGNLPNRLKQSPKLSKALFNGAKVNIAPSYYLLEVFKKEGFTNLTYIPNTIEIKKYNFKKRKIIAPKLLWVRSFAELYNPILAIEIVEVLTKENIAIELCMIGPEKDGSLKQCKELAEKKNLPITFTGLLSKQNWISRSKEFDIFINTTNFDNTPVSVIEAMALGLPIISTNVGGLPFLIENNKTGILVEPNNSEAFVEKINELISNPEKALELTKNARAEVEKFDWNAVSNLWKKILS